MMIMMKSSMRGGEVTVPFQCPRWAPESTWCTCLQNECLWTH